jgi:hypothetical protein
MCEFITLIAPSDDAEALRRVMRRHGRMAQPIANASVARVLIPGERQYLTAAQGCDCGTVLIAREADDPEAALAHEAAKLARKGWSQARIARAMDNRRKVAAARPPAAGPDTLELWRAVLADLRRDLRLPYAGLLVRSYRGDLASEAFEATRAEAAKVGPLEPDCVTIFRA